MTKIEAVSQVVRALMTDNVYKATKYLSEKETVKATRRRFKKKIRKGNMEISLVIGKPNFEEREFIKKCKKAKESFPVKKIQLKYVR